MARILVAGATGHLGRHIVTELKRRNHWVRALTRNPIRPIDKVDDVAGGDLNQISSLLAPCGEIDIVISAAGSSVSPSLSKKEPDYETVDYWGNKNLLNIAGRSGIKRFIYVSVFSTPELQHLDYVSAHTRFAHDLMASGLSFAVIQPTGYFSAFDTILDIASTGFAPLIAGGSARTNPIHEEDLAAVCVNAIEGPNQVIPIGGPETHTRRSIFEMAFKAVGKKPRFIKVPRAMISAQSRMVSLFDSRLAQLTDFLQAVSQIDVIAPPTGSQTLEKYFNQKVGAAAGNW